MLQDLQKTAEQGFRIVGFGQEKIGAAIPRVRGIKTGIDSAAGDDTGIGVDFANHPDG